MRIAGTLAAASLCCLASRAAQAQTPPSGRLAEVGVAAGSWAGSADPGGPELRRSLAWARLGAPVPLGRGSALVLGASWEVQRIRYRRFAAREVDGRTLSQDVLPDRLHAVDAIVGIAWKAGERWSVAARLSPGLHGDLGDVRGRDVAWRGSAMAVRRLGGAGPGEGTGRVGLGAAYTDRFGSPLAIPLVLLDWRPSRRWFVQGTLPLDLDAGIRVAGPLSLGVAALAKGYLYRLESAPFDGEVVRYREVQLGPFVDWAPARRTHLRVDAGVSAAHRLQLRDEGDDRTLVSGDLDRSGFLRASVYWAP